MNCYYCKELCQLLSAVDNLSKSSLNHTWLCHRHTRLVRFHTNRDLTSILCNFHTQYKERGYVVDWYKDTIGERWLLSVATDTTNGIAQSDGELIRTQFIPEHITPDNIDKKLPILLIFL